MGPDRIHEWGSPGRWVRTAGLCLVTLTIAFSCSHRARSDELHAVWNRMRGDPYALDDRSRHREAGEACPEVSLVTLRGETMRFTPIRRVNVAFREPLRAVERVVREEAIAMFGRAPTTVTHMGTFVCRPVAATGRWSEHAFGNAIDVSGFSFGRARRGDETPEGLPARYRRAFRVDVGLHYLAPRPERALESRFLHRIVARLRAENVVRGIIGPPDRRHANHIHLDYAPYRFRRIAD